MSENEFKMEKWFIRGFKFLELINCVYLLYDVLLWEDRKMFVGEFMIDRLEVFKMCVCVCVRVLWLFGLYSVVFF